jgi:SNF2 family DNA or RNA helicase
LKVLVLQGQQRARRFSDLADHDVVLTTYPLLARDQAVLTAQPWHLLILDEAQMIRNPRAQASRVLREIDARHRVGLTGTPMENHLGDLWSLFDVLLPGLLGDARQFRRTFRTPIEKHGNQSVTEHLRRRIRPFLLRRTKAQVAAELPEKTEIIRGVVLEGRQRELYETVRLAMHQRVREEIERQGLARSHIVVLDALLKLRQVCCDPRLMPGDRAHGIEDSAKLDVMMEMLPELVEEGRRILLFSQFTRMLALIEERVRGAGIGYVKLTGRTRDREGPVQRFQRGEVPLFLISLKAGGVGLNLTAADTVIHYDPWWNPAVERQATDRAHRIGQRQRVFVYKLLCEDTVEDKIHALQQRKQALADRLYACGSDLPIAKASGGSRSGDRSHSEPQWSAEDLAELLGAMADEASRT